jgi:uncharacterized membrane protein
MQPTMIVLRLFHIFSGVLWVGGVALLAWFIIPAVEGAGPAGGGVMKFLLVKTKFGPYFPALAVLTVLSGITMYWWDASRSNGAFYASPMGITLGIGGLSGVVAMVLGGAVVGRAAAGMARVFRAIDAQGSPPTAEQTAELMTLRAKIQWASTIVLPLLLLAVIAMAIARYV